MTDTLEQLVETCIFIKEPHRHLVGKHGITDGNYYFSGHKMTLIFLI